MVPSEFLATCRMKLARMPLNLINCHLNNVANSQTACVFCVNLNVLVHLGDIFSHHTCILCKPSMCISEAISFTTAVLSCLSQRQFHSPQLSCHAYLRDSFIHHSCLVVPVSGAISLTTHLYCINPCIYIEISEAISLTTLVFLVVVLFFSRLNVNFYSPYNCCVVIRVYLCISQADSLTGYVFFICISKAVSLIRSVFCHLHLRGNFTHNTCVLSCASQRQFHSQHLCFVMCISEAISLTTPAFCHVHLRGNFTLHTCVLSCASHGQFHSHLCFVMCISGAVSLSTPVFCHVHLRGNFTHNTYVSSCPSHGQFHSPHLCLVVGHLSGNFTHHTCISF